MDPTDPGTASGPTSPTDPSSASGRSSAACPPVSATGLQRQFVWTVIPSGRVVPPTAGQTEPMALLSVLLTPRLLGPATGRLTVAGFGMQGWPQRLAAVSLGILRGQQPIPAVPVPYTALDKTTVRFTPAEQLAAWNALFTPGMLVRPYHATSYDGRDTRAFPAGAAGAEVRGIYTATAQAHAAHAVQAAQAGHRGLVPEDDPALQAALQTISEQWQTGLRTLDGGPVPAPADQPALAQAYAFYRRTGAGFTPLTRHTEAAPESEFHDTVVHLADHPVLLRALGLLIDLAVPASRLTPTATSPAELHAVPHWPNPDPNPPPGWTAATQCDLTPATAYTLTGTRFVPAPGAGPAGTAFSQGLLPIDGAGLAPSHNARYEVMTFDVDGAALRLVSAAQSDGATAPAGRTSPPGALPALHSTGFALVDRGREDEHRKQLQRAQQRATPAGLLATALTADALLGGYRMDVRQGPTGPWRSLCRRRLHYTIGGLPFGPAPSAGLLDEGYLRPGPVTTGAGPNDALYLHQTVARWDGWSQVAPRPERTVATGDAMPVRAAPALDAVVECDPGSLPSLRFGEDYWLRVRIADLAGGGLHPDEAGPTEAQTDKLTYLRYEPLSPPELVPTRPFEDGDGQDRMVIRSDRGVTPSAYAALHGYRPYDLRHLLPPKCSLALAMQYDGGFDTALGPDAPAAEVKRLFEVAKRADRELGDVTGAQVIGADPASGVPQPYVTVPETEVVLPWLADPSGAFIALNAQPRPIEANGRPGEIVPRYGQPVLAAWQGAWPDRQTASVRLTDAQAGCTVSQLDARHLAVALGPAQQVTFDIPSCLPYKHVQLFGIALWLGVDPQDPATFQDIVFGRNRLVTPPRTVTLVHAVQRPLSDPTGQLAAQRKAGDHDTVLGTDGLSLHIASTGRIDLHAEWTDHEDAPPAAPAVTRRMAHVGSYEVQHLPPRQALPVIRQEFGDTRHHRVSYAVTAVSRFEDCFGRVLKADPAACLARGTLADTDVPSSARPPAPAFQYAMPTFRWSQTVDGQQTLTRLRQGGGLRVFLARPWFATGDGEVLAVLTYPTGLAPDAALRFVGVAGRDPVRDTGSPVGVLTRDQIGAPDRAQVTLPEVQRLLDAALYPVEFDAQGDRWYADLDLSPLVASSYFPFVRLALARYQPYTVTDAPDVSPVALTEPVQLPPHRRLSVTRAAGRATVVLDGLGPGGPGNLVRTELQVRDTAAAAAAGVSGWTTLSDSRALLGQTSVISIPDTGARPQRLVVREFETQPVPATGDGTGRPVYVDIVPLGTW
ncbi:hypothetical protein BX285_4614 [Streptomyces sp. 1114.5]|uniref:hypothetical protein n=1 Tax=Streptomyces sp. 1114.5 TaxID=1938830 RepID=UPI000F259DC2|nr:hypothetical protein [Streptomyces sp. 1114.5]RKT20133.1 hypothetical protein BX285_4614 [Streptomyces sp. 1114.5]